MTRRVAVDTEVWHGEAVATLRERMPDRSVDLVYMDPPFGTGVDWHGTAGAFTDRWRWDAAADAMLQELPPLMAALIPHLPIRASARAYLATMGRVLLELHRVLRPTGTLLLHCDDTMRAYLRHLIDLVFGPTLTRGEIIWKRTTSHTTQRRFPRVHDVIIATIRQSPAALLRAQRFPAPGFRSDDGRVSGFIDLQLSPTAGERLGYPTQKPVKLLERLVGAFSLPGDRVLDPMCGSGTTLVAALALRRSAIGIDSSADAVATTTRRLARPAQHTLFDGALAS